MYIKYGNGVETWYKYDPARRWLTDIVTKNPRGNVTYQDISYELDAVGNVKGYRNDGDMYMTGQRYEYDDLYQLVEARGESIGHPGTGLPVYNSNYTQTFAFDSIGNMTDKTSGSLYSTVQPPGVNLNYKLQYEYLPGTHKASRIGDMYYGYDGNGNLVTEQAGSPVTAASNAMRVSEEGGVYSTEYGFALRSREGGEAEAGTAAYRRDYAWNERNLLQRSADRQYQVEYRYGADGQRAVKFSQGGGVAAETRYFNQMLHTSSGVTGELVSKHIYVGETRIVTKRRQAGNENYGQEYKSQYFYHGDHLGSAQLVTDSEGKAYEHLEYTPYGELWVDRSTAATGNSPTPFRFTGKEFDPETGLYYYGARYLDPKTSRWISADPAMGEYVPQAPTNDEAKRYNKNLPGMGGVFNTVNLHVYHYAGNNPVVLKDPDGRDIVLLNRSYGAGGFGHNAVLIGNDKDGWILYSKDNCNKNAREEYRKLDYFINKNKSRKEGDQYDNAVLVETTKEQDDAMKERGNEIYNRKFAFGEKTNKKGKTSQNCADLAADIIGEAGGSVLIDKPKLQKDDRSRPGPYHWGGIPFKKGNIRMPFNSKITGANKQFEDFKEKNKNDKVEIL